MNKDVIIFVNAIRPKTFQALRTYAMESGRSFKPVVFVDTTVKEAIFACNGQNDLPEEVEIITADFNSPSEIRGALAAYQDRIFAVTSQYENSISELQRLLPFLPYISLPTEKSLDWATEKRLMRKLLEAYDPDFVPRYVEISDLSPETLQKVESRISYPLIVKPSGLEGSLLVTLVTNRTELVETLERTFDAMQKVYDTWIKRQEPTILIEEFMEGDMYTVDVYVDGHGTCQFAPIVGVITGYKAGYDDFFGYRRFLPSGLNDNEVEKCKEAAAKACHALGLRSITAHVELMRTEDGWKIIELGPRIGGYRHELYDDAYSINHIVNDIRNRAGERPEIPTDLQKHSSFFNIYAPQEGILRKVHGVDKVKELSSFHHLKQVISEGEPVAFAKNGGDIVLGIMLSHTDKQQLDTDIAAMEAAITFDVSND